MNSNKLMINIDKLYEFLDTTAILARGGDILEILNFISDNDGKIDYFGQEWDFTE